MKYADCLCWVLAAVLQINSSAAPPRSEPYVWRNVAIGGGGFITGILFHPTARDLLYARTDVGGAYRWDAAANRWIPLNDWLSPTQNNFTGIESIGLDPADPNRVYLAAGTYSRGPAAILRSDDQGKTFQVTEVPFRMGGNEEGRHNGERLVVDPNDGTVLFFGSRREGLWKSTDRGVSWKRVESFTETGAVESPVASTNVAAGGRRGGGFGGRQAAGVISVVFDESSGHRGSPTPVIYAAVSTSGTNCFRSADAGGTWQSVAGQPVGLRPSHLIRAMDGLLYLTYGSAPGPNNVTDGAVWKFNPKDGVWWNISPEKPASGQRLGWGYGAVVVDSQHPSTIVVTTICRWGPKDEVFRSTDGGPTWKGILVAKGQLDYSMAPYTRTRTPHWTGTVAINPHNSDQVLFGTGYGIWASLNATKADSGEKVTWVFLDKGLEETVPLALISPLVGPHLISGLGDLDGFCHADMDVSPVDGTFAGPPRYGNTEDLAFAARKPELIIRAGTGGRGSGAHAAISEDSGKTWKTLAGDPPGGGSAAGMIALAADGRAVVWTPRRGSPHLTLDRGLTWTNCEGLTTGARVIADPVNASRFYSLDARAGKLFVSTNTAATFELRAVTLPAAQEGFGGGSGMLALTPGLEGNLWVGTRNGGLHHSTDSGLTFTKLDGVDGVDALGFGKAAPGKTSPTLYILGTLGGLRAYYRSDDVGRAWVRINDDQHQYAFANRPFLIGDPRIYGRVYFTTGGRGIIYGDPAPSAVR